MRHLAGCAAVTVVLLLLPHRAVGQVAVTVETSNAARQKLRLVDEYLANESWDEAVALLQQTLDDHATSLVALSPTRFLNVTGRVNRLLVTLPPAGLAVYRRGIDPRARRWFETGRDERDESSLRRIVREAFASRWCDEALWLLGQRAWEADRPRAAAGYWRQLLPAEDAGPNSRPAGRPRFPGSVHAPAELRARLVLCHCLEGRLDLARDEWNLLKQRHPESRGRIAGEQGVLVDLLEKWLTRPGAWQVAGPPAEHATLGGTPLRNGIDAVPFDPGAALWQIHFDGQHTAARPTATDRFPVVVGDRIFVADSFAVRGFRLDDGQPAWPRDGSTDGVLYPVPSGVPVRAALPRSGRIITSLCASDGRLFARIGSPVTATAAREPRPVFHELVGLDIRTGEGKLTLQIETAALPETGDQPRWSFDGPPVVSAGRLWVATRRGHPQVQLGVACFDTASGKRIWHRQLGAAATDVDESLNVVTHNVLSLADGTLFYSGDLGVTAALDANIGTIRWLHVHTAPEHTGPHACLPDPASGLVFLCTGTASIVALDSADGSPRWQRSLPGGIRHLLGVRGGLLVASGRSLWALRTASGRVAWQRLARQTHQQTSGRGLVTAHVVFWPTRDLLHLLDLATGRPRRQPLRLDIRGCSGGNLLLSKNRLVISANGQLTVLGPFAGTRGTRGPLVSQLGR